MKRFFLFVVLVLVSFASIFAEDKYDEKPFDGGIVYIALDDDGNDDLNSSRIEYDNGDRFFGELSEDLLPVYGTLYNDSTKEYYTGSFDENEKYTGEGTLDTPEFYYEGRFKDGKRNGYGYCLDKKTNKIYEGNFVNGKRNGQGKEYKSDSNLFYEGYWVNNVRQGKGVLISDDGTKFEGSFEDGSPKGVGTKTNSTGEILKGCWENTKFPEGEDCSYISDKVKYSGEIKDGKFDGVGVYIATENNVTVSYEGSFLENQRTGFGQQVYSTEEYGENIYTGYYYANQRNHLGSFKFSNGLEYEGGFLDGQFYGTGYLSSEDEQTGEITIIASDEWDGLDVPENSDGATTSDGNGAVASVKLPRTGKILFSNGDMWEGFMSQGYPVAGLGIWTTQEERIARKNRPESHVVLASYQLDGKNYDFSSVYDAYEVSQIINSEAYLVGFNDFYKKHKGTIDNIVGGLQIAALVLSFVPSPIQPIAKVVDIGLSAVQIALKTTSTAIDIHDACVAGNEHLIPGMLKEWGKDIAWDAVNIIFATPGAGKAIGKISEKAAQGMGKAGEAISKTVGKVISKNPTLAKAAERLGKLGSKVGGGVTGALESLGKTPLFRFVAENGGKLTKTVKTGWIRKVYPDLFAKYGDDAVRLLFKHGDDIARQMTKNGDVITKAARKYGDDVVRVFLKNGDEIAKVARASEYPEAIVKYIKDCSNIDDAIKLASKNPSLGKVVSKYGDDAIKCIEKYGDDAIKVFEKNGSQFSKALKKFPPEKHDLLLKFFAKYSDEAGILYAKYQDSIIDLFEKAGPMRQDKLIKAISRDGDKAIALLKNTPASNLRKTIDVLAHIPADEYITLRLISKSDDYIKTLSAAEREIIRKYTTSHYKVINRNLRNGVVNDEIETLKKIISRNKISDDITVFRGENGFIGNTPITMRNGKFNLPAQGDIITNNAFTSTSLKPKYANGMLKNEKTPVISEIQVPKGSSGLYISNEASMQYAKYQQEVLLNANSKFKVLETKVLPAGTKLPDGTVLQEATAYVKMILL